jgi:hypothetical protein
MKKSFIAVEELRDKVIEELAVGKSGFAVAVGAI